jgi:hypothetical protein
MLICIVFTRYFVLRNTSYIPCLVEAAEMIRPSSSPLFLIKSGRRRFSLALSRAFALG